MKKFLPLLLLLFQYHPNDAVDPSQCIAPLGMENGSIKDDDIAASSSFDWGNVGPYHGRVRTEKNGGAWCPLKQATTEPEEWLQVDLRSVHMITATGTQGRFGNGQGVEFAEAYMIEYWRPRLNKWIRYQNSKGEEVIPANINTYLETKKELDPPIWGSKIRFYPHSYHKRTVCMRVELYGCRWTDGLVSYFMPQGDKRGSNWEFFDFGYDGLWDGDELKHGLGQLTDGKFGQDDFKTDFHNGVQTWIGWKNDTRHNKPIEIKFEFDKVREFSAVHIYCNNQFTKDVQVFASAKVLFSIGGKRFNKGEPITYEYMDDRIFENGRNVTIKLHHRVGRFVKLQLHFAAKWMLISEVTFDSIIAHGNFSVEPEPTTTSTTINHTEEEHKMEIPATNKISEPTYLTIIVIVLIFIILLLSGVIYIIYRFKSKKFFGSPNPSNISFPNSTLPQHLQPESVFGMSEKGNSIEAYGVTEIDDYRRSHHGSTMKSSLRSTLPLPRPNPAGEGNEYQEPYQAMKFAPYYSYSSVVMEMQDSPPNSIKKSYFPISDAYDYAIPEAGTLPLLGSDSTLPMIRSRISSVSSKSQRVSSRNSQTEGRRSPTQNEAYAALKKRLEDTSLTEFPRHRLRMLSKLSEGAFGTVYIAEADGIYEYNSAISLGTRLVAIKFLNENSSEKEKKDFYRDIRILAALEDPNIARVLGICSQEEPLCVIMEYLEHADLSQFLKSHVTNESSNTIPYGVKSLSYNCLLYIGAQIASGMRYLETLNFVHRDLAARNCIIGKGYFVKICDFGTYNEVYANDYYKVDGNTPLPIRWMAWESVFQARYSTKSDVWSFGVLLWEILTVCRRPPYDALTDPEVMENLAHMHDDDGNFMYLPRVAACKDIQDLLLECWKRNEGERPTFREIHLFLQRKNLGYAPS